MANNRIDWEQYQVPDQGSSRFEQYRVPDEEPVAGRTSLSALKEEGSKSLVGLGRGFMDVSEGFGQLGAAATEKMGLVPEGTKEGFTQERQKEREFYEQTPFGQSETGQVNRLLSNVLSYLPFIEAGGGNLLSRMATGGGVGGAIGSTQFVEPGESRMQNVLNMAGVGAGLPLVGAGLNVMKTLQSRVNPKELMSTIKSGHDSLKNKASELYDNILNQVKGRNIPNVNLPKETIADAKRLLPDDKETRELIKAAESGEYKAIRDLQSELGEEGYGMMHSRFGSDRRASKEMLSTRKQINKHTKEHLKNHGANDLVDDLNEANKHYSTLHKSYYGHPTIKKAVGKGKQGRIVPKNPMTALTEDSDRINRLLDFHPEVARDVKLYNQQQKLKKQLKKGAKGLFFGTGGLGGGKYLLDQFKDNEGASYGGSEI